MKKGGPWQKGVYDYQQWGKWKEHGPPDWEKPSCRLFLRFLFVFGLVVLLILGGMAVLALLFTRTAGGADQIAPLTGVELETAFAAIVVLMFGVVLLRRARAWQSRLDRRAARVWRRPLG